jgi:DNA-directed RNA polymerase alpha subunit
MLRKEPRIAFMTTIQTTICLPTVLWHAVQALAPQEGDATTVILRAVEEYINAAATRQGNQSGKYRDLVQALSTPVADLHLSVRPASALKMLNIRYVYELVQQSPTDLFVLPNVGKKSLKEVKEKLATLGLTLGMPLEDEAYRAAVVATVAANLEAARA